MKAILVEDDPGTRALVKRIVQQTATTVLEATNGLEALGIIEREDPDIVITDVRMPVLDGFELIAALRGSATRFAIPVICLTAVDQRDDIARLLEAGVTDYVLKPVKPTELTTRLRRVFKEHSKWREKRRQREQHSDAASTVLIIDPDSTFRSSARAQLEPEYHVIDAADAAEGLAKFNESLTKPQTVFIAEGLPFLSEVRAAQLLCDIAAALGVDAPKIYVIVDHDQPATAPGAAITGTVRRSFVPAQFGATARAVLGGGRSAIDQLRQQLLRDSNAWIVSAARHAFSAVGGKEVELLNSETAEGADTSITSAVRLVLPDSTHAVRIRLSCGDDHAAALASDPASPSAVADGLVVLAKLVEAIASDIGVALRARSLDVADPTADTEPDATPHHRDVSVGLQTPAREVFLLTLEVVEHTPKRPERPVRPVRPVRPEPSPAAAPADQPVAAAA